MDAPDDPRPLLYRAIDQVQRLIAQTGEEHLALPTPCGDYDVHQLLGHLVAMLERFTHMGYGGRPYDTVEIVTGVPAGGWVDAAAEARDKLAAVWADGSLLDRIVAVPWGEAPGRLAVLAYTQEFTQHAWDLATAIGRTDELDRRLAEVALASAATFVPAEIRGGPMPFGPVVDVPADADPYERLAGWLGRGTPA